MGDLTMRFTITLVLVCAAVTGAFCQTDPKPFDHSPAIPFNIKLLSPRAKVESLLKERGFVLRPIQPVEGVAPGVFALNIEWNTTAFDTLVVWFTPTSARVASLTLIRACDSDKVPLIVAELTDVVSRTHGDPSFADETMARWERGDEAAVSLGPYSENDAVWLRFDLAPMFHRRPTTKPTWPLALPVITDRDEILDIMRDSCKKVIEEGDVLTSIGCSCFGVKARQTSVTLDGQGRPNTIEMVISRADQAAVQSSLQALYGPPNGSEASTPTWLVDDIVAASITDGEKGLVVTFNVLALELYQYMDK